MSSVSLIVNEWVIHDLRGDNGEQRQRETLQFLIQVEQKCDHIVLLHGSTWMRKAYELMKDPRASLRPVSKFLHLAFLRNPSKCQILGENEVQPLPDNMQSVVPYDDSYLIQLNTAVPRSTIVTTDRSLIERLSKLPNITVSIREEFLKHYM